MASALQHHPASKPRPKAVNMTNRKPFRTAEQKAEARHKAYKAEDGTYRSTAPVSFHPTHRESK